MSLLLDTRILLWWLADDRKLPDPLRELIASEPLVFVSAASAWEISIKRAIGKLRAPTDLADVVVDSGFTPLAIGLDHAEAAGALPRHHDDPFDRMLIAQAIIEQLTIASIDARLKAYDVEIIGA